MPLPIVHRPAREDFRTGVLTGAIKGWSRPRKDAGTASGVRRVAASEPADGVILMDVGLSCVDHDFAAAGALCADHLADLGHREVAFIGYGVYERHTGYAERTLAGFRERAGHAACASWTAPARARTKAPPRPSPVSSPAAAHDLLTGAVAHAVPPGGCAVLRGH
ncbi:DNA-binding LacI/PurR family transcriptional regulator [Streptomyces sp. V4I8]